MTLPRFTREPFVWFLVLGGLCFAAYELLRDDRHEIRVPASVQAQLIDDYELLAGHEPDEQQLAGLIEDYIDDEILSQLRAGRHVDADRFWLGARLDAYAAVATEYTQRGVVHILEGLDHLAFVLTLCLLTRGIPLLLVTSFTLGHSVSLALASLGVISVAMPPVEATIALSIAFMAREALVARHTRDGVLQARWRYAATVGAFGLLHGLGFASALGDLGVALSGRVTALAFFNVGVEIGQLMFVTLVLASVAVLRRPRIEAPARAALLTAVGSAGVFWTLARIGGFMSG